MGFKKSKIIGLLLLVLVGMSSQTVYAAVDDNFTTRRQIPSQTILLMAACNSETSAKISWMMATDAEGYVLYRSKNANDGYKEIATIQGSMTTSYIDKGLETGEKYFYRICSYWTRDGKRVCGDLSIPLYADIRLDVPENIRAISTSFNSIRLTWQSVTGAQGYRVYQAIGKDGEYKKIKTIKKQETTAYDIADLVTGRTYRYKVEAYQNSESGNGKLFLSPRSEEVKVKPMLDPVNVTNAKPVTYNTAKFSWEKVKGASGYVIYRSTKADGKFKEVGRTDKKTFTYTDKKLVTGKPYYYKVVAYRKVDKKKILGKEGTILNIKTSLEQVEMGESKNIDSTSVLLNWNKVDGAQAYVIYRSEDQETYEKVAKIKENTYTDKELTTGLTYYYKVVASRGKKKEKTLTYGPESEVISLVATLPAPTITGISVKNKTDLEVSFEAVEGADGYTLEYKMADGNEEFMEISDVISKDATSYLHSSLASDEKYTYRIRAYSEVDGEKVYGAYSNEESKKTEKYASIEVTQGKAMSASEGEIQIFTALCMREAGNSYKPCLAVANCVLNRVKSGRYPNTITGVIYQSGQFSGVNSGILNRYMNNQSKASRQAVLDALAGKNIIGSRLSFRSKSYFYSSPGLSGIKSALTIGDNTFF